MTATRWGLTLLVAMVSSAGCSATRRVSAAPLPLRLSSPTPFEVYVRESVDGLVVVCRALRVDAQVQTIDGDTLWLAAAHARKLPRGAPDCLQGRAGFIVTSAHPELQSESVDGRPLRTLTMIVLMIPLAVLINVGVLLA